MSTDLIKEQKQHRFTFYQMIEAIEGIFIMLACYLTLFLKPLRDRWGLSREEAKRTLPGDEVVALPNNQFTHAVEINVPPENVWPWIAQIGQRRGGFYSYEALENLTGLNIYNSDEILPEFQNPQIGDLIPFGPTDAYPLVVCEQGKAMAIGLCFDLDKGIPFDPKEPSYPSNYFQLTWLWYVEPVDGNRSRFFSRNRVAFTPSFKNRLMIGLLSEPMIFAMDRKMCLGIKRAEKMAKYKASNVIKMK